jgi:hypothetical protein
VFSVFTYQKRKEILKRDARRACMGDNRRRKVGKCVKINERPMSSTEKAETRVKLWEVSVRLSWPTQQFS